MAAGWLWTAKAAPEDQSKKGFFSFLEPARLTEVIKKQVAKQAVNLNFDIMDAAIFEGVTAALQYKYRSEPSYIDGYYTRYDRWLVDTEVNPASWVDQLQSPVGIGISAGSELVFARQFKTQTESVTAKPYLPDRIPLSADRALNKLDSGDFVSFETHTGVVASVSLSVPQAPAISQSGSTHIYLEGRFLIQLYKADADHIRVKLIARRGLGGGADYAVGAGRHVRAIGLRVVERQVRRFVELDPVNLGVSRDVADLFLADYVFNLRDPEAAAAFENLMTRKVRFKSLEVADPIANRNGLEKALITDLSEVEALSLADAKLPESERRVARLFKGSNASDTVGAKIGIGLNLFRLEKSGYFSENRIQSFDDQEVAHKYRFDNYSQQDKRRFLFRLFDSTESINSGVLFEANEQYEPSVFNAMVMSREIKSSSLMTSEFDRIREQLRRTLPEPIYSQIQWRNWDYKFNERVNVYFRHQITFTLPALEALPALGAGDLYVKFKAYLATMPSPSAAPTTEGYPLGESNSVSLEDRYDLDLQRISVNLMKVADRGRSTIERYKAFVELKDNELFREVGAGFLLRLLPQDRLDQLVHYEFELSAKGSESIRFTYGEHTESRLYQTLLYIQSILNNRSIDLRLMKR